MERFQNRTQAAQLLADELESFRALRPVVLGIPRGAVPMAKIIADRLGAELDVVLVKKVAHPRHPEFALASVTEEGEILLGTGAFQYGMIEEDLEDQARKIAGRLREVRALYTHGRPAISLRDRNVIVVDDGIATGATMRAAIASLRRQRVRRIVVAAPLVSEEAMRLLENEGVEVVALQVPEIFGAVSYYYENFAQVSDAEVGEYFRVSPREISVPGADTRLDATLGLPLHAKAIVVFAHGSAHGRRSPRNQSLAEALNRLGYATLLADLMTVTEADDGLNQFDIGLLTSRLRAILTWVRNEESLQHLPLFIYGTQTGASAAIAVAAHPGPAPEALLCRSGRPDLVDELLPQLSVPTLFLVGGEDGPLRHLHEDAFQKMHGERRLHLIEGAGAFIDSDSQMQDVIDESAKWIERHLRDRHPEKTRPLNATNRINFEGAFAEGPA